MQRTLASLPENLKAYTSTQDYSKYTPRDQASWRYIMRQSRRFFKDHAHPVYMEGLEKTGIPIDEIPHIDVMHQKLSEFGWGAVCVTGFIPPAAFLEFQARNLLPIAADMRTLEHIAYTPAPDIVHEAAGHAPIIADPEYAHYLTKYARLARKAIYSDQDVNLYEAVRMLSDMKENPDATADVVAKAEMALEEATAAFSYVSESAQITRMYWWTAEYGLVKQDGQLKIYGAGLLSSVGESQGFLSEKVEKIPMSLACIHRAFNITEPQPQLFVAENFQQLVDVLDEMEATMAFRRGGVESIEKAKKARAVTTTVLDSQITVSGIIDHYLLDKDQRISFLKWRGPTQLALHEKEISGQGQQRHPDGFSSPIGPWQGLDGVNPSDLNDRELAKLGLTPGNLTTLTFCSGFKVQGRIKAFLRDQQGHLILITWSDCTVSLGGESFFRPEWGEFDMLVGLTIPSVHGGPADFASFGQYNFGTVSSQPGRQSPFTTHEKALFSAYQEIRDLRKSNESSDSLSASLDRLASRCMQEFSDEWLLTVEVLELYHQRLGLTPENSPRLRDLIGHVLNMGTFDATTQTLIRNGLREVSVPD